MDVHATADTVCTFKIVYDTCRARFEQRCRTGTSRRAEPYMLSLSDAHWPWAEPDHLGNQSASGPESA